MDFAKALTYPFEDEDWVKKLLFLFIGIIPIIGTIAVEGWAVETSRGVRSGAAKPMANWDDFGAVFSRGVPLFLARIVYFLPVLILYCVGFASTMAMGTAAAGVSSNNNGGGAGGALGGLAGVILPCCVCIAVLYAIAAGVVFLGGYVRYLDKPEFGTFMAFGDNVALVQSNIGDVGMAVLYLLGGGVIVALVSWTGIGGLLAIPFLSYFGAHILGQLAAKIGGGAKAAVPQM